jgi:iron complex outermembrane recepter protein
MKKVPFLRFSLWGLLFFYSRSLTLAQNPTPALPTSTPINETTAEAERVIVTGSNIPTAAEVGPNPVQTLDRNVIDKSGERTVEDLVRDLPVAGPQGVPSFNGANAATAGASSISLRGFDPSDTLVLIDGRRVAAYPVGASGTQPFVDLNSIPRAAIDSIEILKDSASSIYGADAVAGVVNFKLRHDYEGAETTVEYGNTTNRDSGEYSASLIFGASNADHSSNITGILNFYHRNSIFDRDRAFSSKGLSVNSSPFNLELSAPAVIAAGGTPPSSADTFRAHSPFFSNGLAPASSYTYGGTSFYNFENSRGAVPDSERYGGLLNADHRIFGEQLVIYADLLYQNVQTHSELAPTSTSAFEQPGHPILAIPPHSPGAVLGGPSYEETGLPFGAYNPFNPFQQIISGNTRGRLAEFGNRLFDNETDAFFSSLGLKGDKLFDGNWGYYASYRYSRIENTSVQKEASATRFNRILNAADPIFDPRSPEYIGTTVPYNPFGDYRVPIPSNTASIDYAAIYPKEIDTSSLGTLDLNIYTTELFHLPAGGVGLAFGGQFRSETLRQRPDQLAISGDILGSPPATFTNADRSIYAFYAEASVPVFSPTYAITGFHSLEFTGSARYEQFLDNNSNVLVPKVGVRWQPFDDSLTLRATWGEGFHEPSLIELFGTPVQFLTSASDPVSGNVEQEVPFIIRSNPNLQPEDSRAFTAGFVYSPRFISGLTLTVDLFDIESKGRVNSSPDPTDILLRALAGRLLPGEKVNRDSNGNLLSIEGAYQNAGSQKARGVDFSLSYQLQTRVGTFTSLTDLTFLDSFQFAGTPDVPERELVGSGDFVSGEAYLRYRGKTRLDWNWQHFDFIATANYRDGVHETNLQTGGVHYIKQTWFFDVQASYDIRFALPVEANPVAGYSKATADSKSATAPAPASTEAAQMVLPVWKQLLSGTTLTIGCNDLLGRDPPHSINNNYQTFLYDPTGRFIYFSLTKKF